MAKQIEVFLAFDKEDGALLKELEKHLKSLEMEGLITVWNASKIIGGTDRQQEINKHLLTASIILLLVSANFMASDEAFDLARQALEKSKQQNVRVIPVLVQEVDWRYSIFGNLSPLPANAKPVATWKDRNAAFLNVVQGIRQIVTNLPASVMNNAGSPTAPVDSDSRKVPSASAPKSSATLTPFRRHVLEEKLKELQRTWESRNKKKQYIQQALDIESDPIHIFRYEEQIKQENDELAHLEWEIERIEQQLQ